MSPIMARSAGIFFAALLILLAASAPASGTCTLSVSDSGYVTDANGIFVLNNIAYIASTSSHGKLSVMPVNPIASGNSYDVTNSAFDVFVSGSTAYMTEGSFGVEVVNAANGGNQGWCPNWDSNLFAIGIYNSGSYAYVGAAGGTTGGCLVVLSLTNPNLPSASAPIASGPMNSGGGGLCVTNDKIYLATDNGVDVFSLSNPANPHTIILFLYQAAHMMFMYSVPMPTSFGDLMLLPVNPMWWSWTLLIQALRQTVMMIAIRLTLYNSIMERYTSSIQAPGIRAKALMARTHSRN